MKPVTMRRFLPYLGLTIFAIVFYSYRVPLRFDFFDMSGFLDAGYRVWIGQKPYIDFLYNAGPFHLYVHAFFFSIFGFGLTAAKMHVAFGAALAACLTFAVGRKYLPLWASLPLSAATVVFFYGPVSFPWYDQNAWLCFFAAYVIAILPLLNSEKPPKHFSQRVLAAGILIAFSICTKINVGVGAGAVITTLLALSSLPKKVKAKSLGLFVLAGFMTCILLVFILNDGPEFLNQTIFAYAKGRLTDFSRLWYMAGATLHSRYMFLWLIGFILFPKIHRSLLGYTLLLTGTLSLYSTWTGSMIREANIPALGFQMMIAAALAALVLKTRKRNLREFAYLALVGILLWVSLVDGVRFSREIFAWNWQPMNLESTYVLKSEKFKGWHTHPRQGENFDRLVDILKNKIPKSETALVMSDMTVAVPVSGREPYKGMPFIFHIGAFPLPGKYTERVGENFLKNPPDWILTHHSANSEINEWFDFKKLQKYFGIEDYVSTHYRSEFRDHDIEAFRKIAR